MKTYFGILEELVRSNDMEKTFASVAGNVLESKGQFREYFRKYGVLKYALTDKDITDYRYYFPFGGLSVVNKKHNAIMLYNFFFNRG